MAVLLACMCLLTTAAAPARAAAASFTLFDNTFYNDAHLGSNYGLTRSGVVYDNWNIACANTTVYSCSLPQEADFKGDVRFVDAQIPATSPLTLDFEGIDFKSSAAAQTANEFQAWQTLIGWVRQVIPASQPLGTYGYDFRWNQTDIADSAVLHQDGLTFFAPSLYTHSYTASAWTSMLASAVTNDHAAAPGQPIYPYIWAQWDVSGQPDTYFPAATWNSELTQLQATTQGAILWSSEEDLTPSSCGWLGATQSFMASLTGRRQNTGALSVTADANACILTRGQSTAVPVTVTNTGSVTSAATSMTVDTAHGISASSARVPALAAGASWSTTVNVTVHRNAVLGDSVATYTLGSGAWHTVMIVQDPDLALGASATQSSTNATYDASLAVDGNLDQVLADGSVAQTQSQSQASWQTDLGRTQHIGAVALFAAYAQPAVQNYYLIVSDNPNATAPSTPSAPNTWVQTVPGTMVMNVYSGTFRYPSYIENTVASPIRATTVIPVGFAGRHVKVQLAGTGQLSLSEVEVRPGAPVTAR